MYEEQEPVLDILYHRLVGQKVKFILRELKRSYSDLSSNLL